MRNKWGKKQNASVDGYTTEELTSALSNWMRF